MRLILIFLVCTLLSCDPKLAPEEAFDRPNIILMMADDLGWQDLSAYGNDRVPTPNIDRIATQGVRFTQFYSASAVCTPTRVSVLTGKYPIRFDVRRHFTDRGEYLPLTVTLPQLLKSAGYRTAHIGKWHLGGVREKDLGNRDLSPGPIEHGFDHYLTQLEQQPIRGELGRERILYRQGTRYLLSNEARLDSLHPHFGRYYTDVNGREAIRFLKECFGQNVPFFINLWWLTPHTPYEEGPPAEWEATAAEDISDDQHRFRSMVARMDYQVGRIYEILDALGITEETIVLFLSDNGGAWEANIGPLKGGKTDLHEGGIRVPFLASWPGHIPRGSVVNELGHTNDLLPTLCRLADVDLPENESFDGVDLLPLLKGETDSLNRGTVFWQMDHYPHLQRHYPKPEPYATEAVRNGRWKMMANNGVPVALYDLQSDFAEEVNLLNEKPDLVKTLSKELEDWLKEDRTPFGRADE